MINTKGINTILDIKNKVIWEIINNKDIVDTLKFGQLDIDDPSDLIYKQIFPYYYIPPANNKDNTSADAKSFITMRTFVPRLRNNTVERYTLQIAVFANKDIMIYKGMIVTDFLITHLVPVIEKTDQLGIDHAELMSIEPYPPYATDFDGYVLNFAINVIHKEVCYE